MRFEIPPRPVCRLTWLLALALGGAALAPGASAAADKPAPTRAAESTRASAPVKPMASTKTAKPSTSTRPAKPAAPRRALKSAASSLALASATAEAINDAQLDIATRVLTGDADCEFNQRITVLPEPNLPGYFRVAHKNLHYRMVPRETTTGAVRLEDPAAGIVWLQIPTKSMLMNTRIGQRLVDACTHAEQRLALAAVADAANGLGILPPAAAALVPATAASAAADVASPSTESVASAAAAQAAAAGAALTLAAQPALTAPAVPAGPAVPQMPQMPQMPQVQQVPAVLPPLPPPPPPAPLPLPLPPAPTLQVQEAQDVPKAVPAEPAAGGRQPQ